MVPASAWRRSETPPKGSSARAGIKHNDVAIINNIVFTATDEGIYYNKAFHTHMDTPKLYPSPTTGYTS